MGFSTAVASKKGGVGKTTTAVSLAAAFAARQSRVLLVDLDPNGSASLSVGLERANMGPGTADVLLDGRPAVEAIRQTDCEALDVMPGTVDLASVEAALGPSSRSELALRRALVPVRSEYDHMIFDSPSGVGLLTRNALAAADCYVVPVVPHFLAVEGIALLLAAAERLRHRCHTDLQLGGILITLADYRSKTTRSNVEALRSRFADGVFAVEVRVNIALAEAPEHGQTIFDFAPHATGAKAYDLVVEELLMRHQQSLRSDKPAMVGS